MERIEQLFDGFADQPPFAFVFCGNFLSRPTANLYINDLSGERILSLQLKPIDLLCRCFQKFRQTSRKISGYL